jgi:hypothetical protein
MTAVQIVLALAAFPVGLTGAWSPCGFSMVETVGLRGDPDGGRTTFAACAAFVPGAAAGGAITFGILGALGGVVHGAGGRATFIVAAAIAIAAGLLEARGVRIVPQIRRQLPESWRWRLPLPLASGLYGVLLGLGFTTFVLSFGVWALAAISFALGSVGSGLIIGLAFGIGRAVPVVVLAPLADHPFGIRCTELMAERPSLYRRARLGDALALAAVATVLLTSTGATAARTLARPGADPSVAQGELAYQRGSGAAALLRKGHVTRLNAREPAIGASRLAVVSGTDVVIRDLASLKRLGSTHARGVDSMAVSRTRLVIVQSKNGRDVLKAARLTPNGHPAAFHRIARTIHPARIGHPSLDGGTVAYGVAGTGRSQLLVQHLKSGQSHVVLGARRAELSNPSIHNGRMLYVRAIRERQDPTFTTTPSLDYRLVMSRIDGTHGRTLYQLRSGAGTLWTTALSSHNAYVTVLKGRGAKIVRVSR